VCGRMQASSRRHAWQKPVHTAPQPEAVAGPFLHTHCGTRSGQRPAPQENPDLFKWLTGQTEAPPELQANQAYQALRQHVARQLQDSCHAGAQAAPGKEWLRGWDDSWRCVVSWTCVVWLGTRCVRVCVAGVACHSRPLPLLPAPDTNSTLSPAAVCVQGCCSAAHRWSAAAR
jgi:hypothetical protein